MGYVSKNFWETHACTRRDMYGGAHTFLQQAPAGHASIKQADEHSLTPTQGDAEGVYTRIKEHTGKHTETGACGHTRK